jgi:hypothetical protein
MVKTTQLIVFCSVLSCAGPLFGAGNLANNGHITKVAADVLPKYFLPADTIPVDAGFDWRPSALSGASNQRREQAPASAVRSRIIPVVPVTVDTTHRTARNLPRDFAGFKIQLLVADSLLAPEHELFHQYGNLCMEELPNQRYAYTFGNFASAQDADRFLGEAVVDRFPQARVIHYERGQRMN